MSITQTHIAIITVTYNSGDFIEDYLDSINSFLSNSNHIAVIVDNDSSDNTCAIINQYAEKHSLEEHIIVAPQKQNIGFGKGCNKGIELAKDYSPSHFWFLNPDTKIFPDSGEELFSFLTTQSDADFAGSTLVNRNNIPRAGAFRFPTLINVCLSTLKLGILDRLFRSHTTAIPIENKPYQADWLTGASFMVKAQCIYQLQGFDPFYFLYFEEVDLFFRAKQLGFNVWACPNSKIFHISGASTGINNHKKAIKRLPTYWFESRQYFYRKNYGRLYLVAVDLMQIICHFIWAGRAKIQNKEDDTPPYFVQDIIRNDFFKLKKKNTTKNP